MVGNARQPAFRQTLQGRGIGYRETVDAATQHQRDLIDQDIADRPHLAGKAKPGAQQRRMTESPPVIEGRECHRDQRDAIEIRLQLRNVICRSDDHTQIDVVRLRHLGKKRVEAEYRLLIRTRLGFLIFDDPRIIAHKAGFFPDFCHVRSLRLKRLPVRCRHRARP
ncbi:hypothetical protein D3C72_1535970 [compost metagenome]